MTDAVFARVLVTGEDGQLGRAFVNRLSGASDVTAVDVETLDLTAVARVREFVRDCRPTLVLNCAAFNDVDGASRGTSSRTERNVRERPFLPGSPE